MKLKLLAVVTLLTIAILPSWAVAWHHSRIQLQCEPANAGLVYASTTTASTSNCTSTTYTGVYGRTANTNYFPCPWNIYTKPVDPTKYKFLYWECTLRVGDVLDYGFLFWSKSATAVGTQYTTASVEGKIYAGLSKDLGEPNTGDKSETTYDPCIVNAIWVAHYEELEHHDVTVSSNNNSLGSVAVTGPDGTAENQVGDNVTITARTENHRVKFLGWKLNGEWVRDNAGDIVREVPYSFTVTEQNKGEYVAYFEGGHDFVRIKNRNTGHYISAQEYFSDSSSDGLLGLQNALETFSLNDDLAASLDDQGSVIKWTSYPRPNTVDQTVNVMEIRGVSTEQYYTVSSGVYLRMTHLEDNSYDIGNGGDNNSFHIVEYNGGIRGSSTATSNMNYLWDFEGMDLDLTTKENYYTPDQLIQGENGLWYGTHRASWNTKYDTEQITAYIITGVINGELQKTEVTGGIIPAGTAVLLECKTNDHSLNVMIPTLEAASFTATGSILTTCDIYFPNQSVNTSDNYKGLTLVNGKIGFGGNALSTIDGNHGYLQLPGDAVLKIPEVTLAELLVSGDTERTYKVTDLTAIELVEQGRMLICKDNNGYASKDIKVDNQYIDFMHTIASGSGLSSTVPSTYDQSNWIGVRLPGDAEFTASALLGKPLKGVTGKLVNTVNPEFVLDKNSLEINAEGIAAKTDLNPYIAASFYGQNHQTSSVNSKEYFFVQPKPMEMANVEWAQWNGEKFVAPSKGNNNNWNDANLQGEFEFNGSYLEQGGVFLEEGHTYNMNPLLLSSRTVTMTMCMCWALSTAKILENGTLPKVQK